LEKREEQILPGSEEDGEKGEWGRNGPNNIYINIYKYLYT
jgi:hypothetical protein